MCSCRNSILRFLGEVVGTRETELSWYNETLVGGILQYGSLDRGTSRYGTVSPWAASVDELDQAWLDIAEWQNERIYNGGSNKFMSPFESPETLAELILL